MIHKFKGAKIFSTFDLTSGYHHIPIKKEDQYKTAFITEFGLFEWKVMPFGPTNAPAVFQRAMNQLFGHLPYVMVYIDDIIIFSKTENQHFKHIQEVFKILNKNKLHIKLEKCHLFKKELKYLGHIINAEGVRPDPKYIEKTLKLVKPKNLQGLQRLLGVIQWVAKYIPRIQEIVQPLNKLKCKNKKFEWTQKHDKVLEKVKDMVKKLPTLIYPDNNK